MDEIKATLKKNTAILDPYAAMVPAFGDLSAKAGVNPGLILAGIMSVLLLVLLLFQGWNILLTTVTVLYPAIHSMRAIDSQDKDDDKVWLTYWIVFGMFTVLETFFGFIFWFIPYWSWIRLGLFIWLLLPNFNGAQIIYENVLKVLLRNNKDLIQHYTELISTSATKGVEGMKQSAASAVSEAVKDPSMIVTATQGIAKVQQMAEEAQKPQLSEVTPEQDGVKEADNRD